MLAATSRKTDTESTLFEIHGPAFLHHDKILVVDRQRDAFALLRFGNDFGRFGRCPLLGRVGHRQTGKNQSGTA